MSELQQKFHAAADAAQSLSKRPSNNDLLALYALYKQATTGDVQGRRPGMFDVKGGAKFDAWTKLKGVSADTAMQSYINLVAKLQKVS